MNENTHPLFSVFKDEHFIDLTIYQYGYEKCKPLHSFGPYIRNHYLFHYIISGKGMLKANDEKENVQDFHLGSDCGFIIEPNYVNTYSADKYDPWEYVWIEFGGLRAKECIEAAGVSHKNPVYIPDTKAHGDELKREMLGFVGRINSSSMEQIGHLYLFLDQLIKYSSTRRQQQGGKMSEFYAKEIISYIEGNYEQNITVEDMAKRCKLDRSYFGKVFKSVIGQSPQEFLIQYRMAKAAEFLTTTTYPIGQIGSMVGYPNALHFSRAFKSIYGMSPREYRQVRKLVDKS